jgi:hypothetical protein
VSAHQRTSDVQTNAEFLCDYERSKDVGFSTIAIVSKSWENTTFEQHPDPRIAILCIDRRCNCHDLQGVPGPTTSKLMYTGLWYWCGVRNTHAGTDTFRTRLALQKTWVRLCDVVCLARRAYVLLRTARSEWR